MRKNTIQHVYIIGAKSIGQYGGFETFVDKLTEYHQNNPRLRYHIACKANGDGHMDERKLTDPVKRIDRHRFLYHNAECFKIRVPHIGAAQAIYYDLAAFRYCYREIKKKKIQHPIIYILACRIGPFMWVLSKLIQKVNGRIFVNPDGYEWMRGKWSKPIRQYWKWSERQMIRYADQVICDSKIIERYVQREYSRFNPKTTYIAYGADTKTSSLSDVDPVWNAWLRQHKIIAGKYYLIVGRFVPENNFESIISEFMQTKTDKDLVIVTTANDKLLHQLEKRLHFSEDERIKFVGTVYQSELLKKIRENAYAYIHGHAVGGTNPSLLEALASTRLNILYDIGFNREVGGDAAFYWR